MKFLKHFIFILVLALIFLIRPNQVAAKTAGSSAALLSVARTDNSTKYNRTIILRNFLEKYNSPLAPHASDFIEEAEKNKLDWKLVAAIAGNESYFGHMIPPYSYNAWGYGVYGNNVRNFTSWTDGISVVSKAIRTDYLNNWGATNVYEIGAIYAEDPNWANKITHYMTLLEEFESKNSNNALSISI